MLNRCILILLSIPLCAYVNAKEDISSLVSIRVLCQVRKKTDQLEQKPDQASPTLLSFLFKQEAKLQRKPDRKDSATASKIFGEIEAACQQLPHKLNAASIKQPYIRSPDTTHSSLTPEQWTGHLRMLEQRKQASMQAIEQRRNKHRSTN